MAEIPTTATVQRHPTPISTTASALNLKYTQELIESAIKKLSTLAFTNPATSVVPSQITERASTGTCSLAAPAEFSASLNDPVYLPSKEDVLRQIFFLRLHDEYEFTRAVYTSHIDPRTFRGFLRTLIPDSPMSKLHSPIVRQREARYSGIFDICGRLYVQNLAEDGSSKLVLKTLIDKGEYAELRVLVNNVIGAPSEYLYRTVHIYEEEIRDCDTGTDFSLTFYGHPLRVPHRPSCLCPDLYASRLPHPVVRYPARSYPIE